MEGYHSSLLSHWAFGAKERHKALLPAGAVGGHWGDTVDGRNTSWGCFFFLSHVHQQFFEWDLNNRPYQGSCNFLLGDTQVLFRSEIYQSKTFFGVRSLGPVGDFLDHCVQVGAGFLPSTVVYYPDAPREYLHFPFCFFLTKNVTVSNSYMEHLGDVYKPFFWILTSLRCIYLFV